MNVKSIIPSKRRLTFSLVIVSLIAVFFIGYYFYFIPRNKDILHKNGFGILENIRQNIIDRNDYLETSFINIIGERKSNGSIKDISQLQKQLDNYSVGGKISDRNYLVTGIDTSVKSTTAFNADIDAGDSTVALSGIRNDSIFYQPVNVKKPFNTIYVPARNFMQPLVANQKNELFEAYVLISKTSGLVYMDAALAINPGITEDSLVHKGSKSLFAGLRDITIKGVDYKMFYYPFKLGKEYFHLCGFINADTYFNTIQQVPVTFIYPIVIALVLIIILLPIVKFYMMGKDEHVKYSDFILSVLSFVAGTAMLTLIIIQVLLLWGAEIRTKGYLENISAQIDSSFTKELTGAYKQLARLDSLVYNIPEIALRRQAGTLKNYNVSQQVKKYFQQQGADTSRCYYNYNRVSWVDVAGNQIIKGNMDSDSPVYTNVAARNYFKVLKNNEGFFLPAIPAARLGFEPVNSWTNGDFSIIISQKSRLDKEFIAALSAQMPSVMQTILPPGFGFCIMDAEGKVMLHAEMNRSLQENFIDKTDPSRPLKEALKSRQESFFKDINLYGKNHALHISPIAATPFYLATFYDKGYIVPVNMRILTFSIMFCIISFFTCALLWMGIFNSKQAGNLFLHNPMHYLNWVMPKEKNVPFYILGISFLIAYLVIQVMMIFSFTIFEISNYAILILVVLLPVNVFCGLFIIQYRVEKDEFHQDNSRPTVHPKKAIRAIIMQPVAVAIAYWASVSSGYPLQPAFLIFEILFFIFLCIIPFLPKNFFHYLYQSSRNYLCLYSRFTTLLLVCISVLPASLYTWYAHNQEITQSIKKQQLYLAQAIQQRSAQNLLFIQKRDSLKLPVDYFEQLQFKNGIYKIFGDVITADARRQTRSKEEKFERFYFSVANVIGSNYYDPQLIPALKDSATGNAWQWSSPIKKDSISFWYSLYQDANERNSTQSLQITSAYPKRFLFGPSSFRGVLLILIIGSFIYGLYLLLRYLSMQIFLRKYIPAEKEKNVIQSNKVNALFEKYKILNRLYLFLRYWSGQIFLRKYIPATKDKKIIQSNGVAGLFEKYKILKEKMGTTTGVVQANDILEFKKEYDSFIPVRHHKALYQQEADMIAAQDKYKDFYVFIWSKCTDKEKYLLLDFAQNGFVNFKNTEVIFRLFQQGILTVYNDDEEVKLFSASFRSFILSQKQSVEMTTLQKEFQQASSWQTFRMPLLIILFSIAAFIFFTQEQTFQKITALVAGVGTILSIMLKFFSDGTGLFSAKK